MSKKCKLISIILYPPENVHAGVRFTVMVHREYPRLERWYKVSRASYLRMLRCLEKRVGGGYGNRN